jgi:hypothetical protein
MQVTLFLLDFDQMEPLRLLHKASDEIRLEEGSRATLTCSPTPLNSQSVIWKNLPKETVQRSRKLANGSLEIRDISQSESNKRILCKFSPDEHVTARRLLKIYVARSGR